MKYIFRATLTLLLSIGFTAAFAGSWNTNAAGVLLDGYDAVSCQMQDLGVKGRARHAAQYDGVELK